MAQKCSAFCEASGVLLLESNVTFVATDTNVTISNLPSSCNYTVGFIKVYGNFESKASVKTYDKNAAICNGKESITINYEDKKTIIL